MKTKTHYNLFLDNNFIDRADTIEELKENLKNDFLPHWKKYKAKGKIHIEQVVEVTAIVEIVRQ
jgi:hypothetical protein